MPSAPLTRAPCSPFDILLVPPSEPFAEGFKASLDLSVCSSSGCEHWPFAISALPGPADGGAPEAGSDASQGTDGAADAGTD